MKHSEDYLIYLVNNGENLSIDELSLSKGELFTFVTNKNGIGNKKTHVTVHQNDSKTVQMSTKMRNLNFI